MLTVKFIYPVRSLARAKGASPEDLGGATSNGMQKYFNIKFLVVSIFLALVTLISAQTGFAQTSVTLQSVSPASAKVGEQVVITGSNLLQCAPVNFNTCNVQFHDINLRRSTTSGIENSNTQVTVSVAAGLCPGTTTIKVGEVIDFSNSIPFTIQDEPGTQLYAGCRVITSIAPTSGISGTAVTINGRNLHNNVQLYDSSFGKTDVAGTMNAGATQVTFTVPSWIIPGTYSVRVGPNVNDVSNGLSFTVIGDTTVPFMSNIRIRNITTSGATVTWDTNELADGQVEFCLTNIRCNTNTPLISGKTTSHVVVLSGLTSNKRYYLWVKSRDGAGNLATGGPLTLKTWITVTPTPAPPPAPIISNIQITNVTNYAVTVTFDTDRPTTSLVIACTNTVYCSGAYAINPTLTLNHSLTIDNLRPDSNYYVWITVRDNLRIKGQSTSPNFRTQPGLAISNLNASATASSIIVNWNTNYPANSLLIVCQSSFWCYGAVVASDLTNVLSHSLSVTGLSPGTNHYYYVVSKDSSGYRVHSGSSVITLP